MSFSVGDIVFSKSGQPGVVKKRDAVTGDLDVETSGKEFEKTRLRGFVNGLSINDRRQFSKVLDDVRQIKDPNEKIAKLQSRIAELNEDPRNFQLVRYLNAELSHIRFSENIMPNQYVIDEV